MVSKQYFTYILGIILISGAMAGAQTLPPVRAASDYNVELTNFGMPKYVGTVPADGQRSGLYMNSHLRRIAEWQPSGGVAAPAAVLKTEFWLDAGTIRFEVLAYLGEIAPDSRPPDWEKLQKIKIASRVLPMDQVVTIDETRRVGIEPFQVRGFRAGPWSIGPPQVVNKTQALNVEKTTEERPDYVVTLRNVSTKNIAALQWYGVENDRKGSGGGLEGMRLIPGGRVFQVHQHFANAGEKQTDDSSSELPRRRQIVIAAVLFDDGSFEGDEEIAAGVAVHWVAESFQFARLISVLETDLANLDPDQNAALTKLKAEGRSL
jgi:hypothetical protein